MTDARNRASGAGASRWRVDPATSRISFEARWMFGARTARGVFERFAGWATLHDDGSLVGELTMDPSSVNTGIRLRDRHLQNRLFLDSGNHPVITFMSRDIRLDGPSLTGAGHLVVRDRGVEVPLRGAVRIDAEQLTLSGSATLDVRRFGWPTALGYIGRSLVVDGAISLERHA
ncbi:YceI family protein [Nocardia flavorosea]|uniref:YceI family protein n=1 Tax=Nocardia flavorosea TaxID=53429 RepID=UPI002457B499|nr:YceI family protein [Nocardia flavorosea]